MMNTTYKVTYKVRSVGGSLVVTLPQYAVRQAGLKAGDDVTVLTTGETIVIRAAKSNQKPKGKK